MKPYKLINIGEAYQRPGYSTFWVVTNKNDEEKMVELTCSYCPPNAKHNSIWLTNRNSLFKYPI